MIRKLKSGEYRLYARKPQSVERGRRNLGIFASRTAATRHEIGSGIVQSKANTSCQRNDAAVKLTI